MKKMIVALAIVLVAGPAMAWSDRGMAAALDEFARQQEQAQAQARYDIEMRRLQEERQAQVRQWEAENERLRQAARGRDNSPVTKYIWGQDK